MIIPLRVTFCTTDAGLQEVIVQDFNTAYMLSAAYANKKYSKGESAGGTLIRRADLPRLINVPVGTKA